MRSIVHLVAIALAVALGAGSITAAPAGALNIYSARHYDTDQQVWDGFSAETGIRVNVIQGSEDALIERIKAEGRNSPADVLITVDAGRLYRAQEAGILQRVTSQTLAARIPAHLRDPDGHWFGFATRARVLVYARDRVRPADLSTYEALGDARWRGRIAVRSSSNVYNQSLVGALLAAHGEPATEQWARRLVANFARPPQGGDTDQIKAVAAGEADVALVNHYYYLRLVNSSDPAERAIAARVAVFFPNQGSGQRGTHVNISGAGIAANAPNRAAAIAFLEYLASPAAQALFARASYEYPVVAGVPRHPSLVALGPFRTDRLNARVYGANNARALLIMTRAGWR